MIEISLPYFSGNGHTASIAKAIAAGATANGVTCHVIDVQQITDKDWAVLDRSQAIIFGSPTYMGSVAAAFGTFIEEAAERWMDQHWADKIAGGFTVGTNRSGDKLAALQRLSVFAAQMGMIWVGPNDIGAPVFPEHKGLNRDGSWLGIMASSVDEPRGAVHPDDLITAERFGRRVSKVTKRFHRA